MSLINNPESITNVAATPREAAPNIVSAAAIALTTMSFNDFVSVAGGVLTLMYIWCALPRWWKTCVAFKRGIVNRAWDAWHALEGRPPHDKGKD